MKKTVWYIALGIIVVVALQVTVGLAVFYWGPGSNDPAVAWQLRGQFGDMFGVATALFNGLALAAMAATLYYQSKELSLQRQELAKSGSALQAQVEAMKETARLNAMNTLVNHYNSVATRKAENTARQFNSGLSLMARMEGDSAPAQLEQVISQLEKSLGLSKPKPTV